MPATLAPRTPTDRWFDRLLAQLQRGPASSHLLRATDRYINRLGDQFAGSITYFSVLALVPMLMFLFAGLGLVLTVLRPQWLDLVHGFVIDNIFAGPMQDQVINLINQFLFNWRGLGVAAIAASVLAGVGWMANIKSAIRGMGRPDFDINEHRHFFPVEVGINLLMWFVMILLAAISFSANVVGTRLATRVVSWFHLSNVMVSAGLVQSTSLVVSAVVATLLFIFIFSVLPEERAPWPAIIRGSVGAAICFVVLQAAAGWLSGLFALSRATQIFGPIIVVMLFLNFFARLILFTTAWIATWNQPAIARRYNPCDEILRGRKNTLTVPDHWRFADEDRVRRFGEVAVASGPSTVIRRLGLQDETGAAGLSHGWPAAQRVVPCPRSCP